MNFNQADEKLLKEALALQQKMCLDKLVAEAEFGKITFTLNFESKMQKLIKDQKKSYYILINTVSKRVACVIIAVLVSLAVMMSVDAIREPVIRYIIKVFEDHSEVYFREESDITPETFEAYSPTYIPKGYKMVNQEGTAEYLYNNITYMDEAGNKIEFQQDIATGHMGINTEGVETEKIHVNNLEAIYCENLDICFILLADNDYSFFISCQSNDVNKDDIIKIAESIKPEKK